MHENIYVVSHKNNTKNVFISPKITLLPITPLQEIICLHCVADTTSLKITPHKNMFHHPPIQSILNYNKVCIYIPPTVNM